MAAPTSSAKKFNDTLADGEPSTQGLNAARIVAAIDPDAGWTEVVVPIESIAHATGDFLRLGSEVEVLAPSDLREAMRDAVTGMVALYDDAPAE